MNPLGRWLLLIAVFGASFNLVFATEPTHSGLGTIQAPSLTALRGQTMQWAQSQPQLADKLPAAESAFQRALGLPERVAAALGVLDERVAQLLQALPTQPAAELLNQPILRDETLPGFARANLVLVAAKVLTQRRLHEEALALLRKIPAESVAGPRWLLFLPGRLRE